MSEDKDLKELTWLAAGERTRSLHGEAAQDNEEEGWGGRLPLRVLLLSLVSPSPHRLDFSHLIQIQEDSFQSSHLYIQRPMVPASVSGSG